MTVVPARMSGGGAGGGAPRGVTLRGDAPRGDAPRGDAGFALLAALLVAAIAVLFAGVAVAAALASLGVTASDGSHGRARAAAKAGLDHGLHRLCWTLVAADARFACEVSVPDRADSGADVTSRAAVTLTPVEAVSLGWPSATELVRVSSEARFGGASSSAVALVALRPSAVPRGLSVAEDADVAADLTLDGCGAYVGGVLRGREGVAFVGAGGSASPPDHAWGGRWPAAGVHAGAGIWAAGVDTATFDPLPAAYTDDTVGPDVAELVELPDAAWLAAAREHALDPGDALVGGVLRLDRLPPTLPTGEPAAAEAAGRADVLAGYVVFVPARAVDGGVLVTGVRDPSWCPVTVAIEGDAVLAAGPGAGGLPPAPGPGVPGVALRGALVVSGSLRVAAATSVCGHLACRRLSVAAPLSLRLEPTWRERPPVGSLEPLLLARNQT